MKPLTGLGVLVTRPLAQAEPICELIEHAGGSAVRCPVLAIGSLPLTRQPRSQLRAADDAPKIPLDYLIFVSANAVIYGLQQLDQLKIDWRAARSVLAVGPATAKSLEQSGIDTVRLPANEYSHRGLLALTELQSLNGCHVGIICGARGSDELSAALRERGGKVSMYRVYERHLNRIDMTPIIAKWRAGGINMMILTSVEIASGLKTLLAEAFQDTAAGTPWIAPSERVAAACRRMGLDARYKIAVSALDNAVVQAVIDLHHSLDC